MSERRTLSTLTTFLVQQLGARNVVAEHINNLRYDPSLMRGLRGRAVSNLLRRRRVEQVREVTHSIVMPETRNHLEAYRRVLDILRVMKAWHLLVLLVACAEPPPDVVAPPETCTVDIDCSVGICARTGECVGAAETMKAQVIWTIGGESPDEQSCYWSRSVTIEFKSQPEVNQGETWESGSLSCTLGKFTVDKLPRRFWIGGAKSPSAGMWVPLDDAGVARVDIP